MSMKDTENGIHALFYCNDRRVLDVWTRFPPIVGDEVRTFGKIYKIVHRIFIYDDFTTYHFAYSMEEVQDD